MDEIIRLNDYEPLWGQWYVDTLICKGNLANVYQVRNGEDVAVIKVISVPKVQNDGRKEGQSFSDNQEAMSGFFSEVIEAFEKELNHISVLDHIPGVLQYQKYKAFIRHENVGYDFILLQEKAQNLSDYFQTNKNIKNDEIIRIIKDVAEILVLAHDSGIVHKDIKFENLFLNEEGETLVADFCLARRVESFQAKNQRKLDTTFIAPEVLSEYDYDVETDLYALGVVMYIMLNDGMIPSELMKRSFKSIIPAPVRAKSRLSELVLKSISYREKDRFLSAKEFVDALSVLSAEDLMLSEEYEAEKNKRKRLEEERIQREFFEERKKKEEERKRQEEEEYRKEQEKKEQEEQQRKEEQQRIEVERKRKKELEEQQDQEKRRIEEEERQRRVREREEEEERQRQYREWEEEQEERNRLEREREEEEKQKEIEIQRKEADERQCREREYEEERKRLEEERIKEEKLKEQMRIIAEKERMKAVEEQAAKQKKEIGALAPKSITTVYGAETIENAVQELHSSVDRMTEETKKATDEIGKHPNLNKDGSLTYDRDAEPSKVFKDYSVGIEKQILDEVFEEVKEMKRQEQLTEEEKEDIFQTSTLIENSEIGKWEKPDFHISSDQTEYSGFFDFSKIEYSIEENVKQKQEDKFIEEPYEQVVIKLPENRKNRKAIIVIIILMILVGIVGYAWCDKDMRNTLKNGRMQVFRSVQNFSDGVLEKMTE